MNPILTILVAGALLVTLALWVIIRSRNMQYWIGSYLRDAGKRVPPTCATGVDVYFCFADHFEPYGYGADSGLAYARVKRWTDKSPTLAKQHRDSDGNYPVHSFFYPAEEYDPRVLDQVKTICDQRIGDVEVHLHHDNDTAENLELTLNRFKTTLFERHGFLRKDAATGEIIYGFIHGNWALDNSRPDGRWCGVTNELDVLVRTGCRYDMTMPSAPSDTQTAKINSIYFARGHDGKCKSHDAGRDVKRGEWAKPGELLLVQGPLCFNWKSRKFGVIPRIESAEISQDTPPSAERVALWESCAIGIDGAPGNLFIKIHTHGAVDDTMDMLFEGGGFETLWNALEARFRDRPGYRLHYFSAWDMYRKIHALAAPAGAARPLAHANPALDRIAQSLAARKSRDRSRQ
ncbi:MAG: hypothetical protein IPP88_20690 [Betaproteobacteria bacterium]|nr:hypothetical protein [Betaproteobacteria bacterium]